MCEGMLEAEARRVEELAHEAELAWPAVHRIAGDGEIDRREMDADLVRPARLEPHVEQRMSREELDHLEMRDRVARRVGVERAADRVAAIATDWSLDPSAAGPRPPDDEREVVAIDSASTDERLQSTICLLRAGDDHQAGRVAVEAVDDPGSFGVAACDVSREQSVHQRPAGVPRRGMDNEAGRLVDYHQVLVLVGNAEVHLLRHQSGLPVRRRLELHLLPTRKPVALADDASVDEHAASLEQPFRHASRPDLGDGGKEAVEALPGGAVRNALLHARTAGGRTATSLA